jgi:hypothetical protein
MGNVANHLMDTLMQVLAVAGAIALLFTVSVGRVAIMANSAVETGKLRYEINRQFLLFSLLVVVIIALVVVGISVPVALGAALMVLLLIYGRFELLLLMGMVSLIVFLLLQNLH